MATIMMPQLIDQAIKEMCSDAMTQAVTALAEKYEFDADDANRFLDASSIKIVRKRGPSSKTVSEEKSPKSKSKPVAIPKFSEDLKPLFIATPILNNDPAPSVVILVVPGVRKFAPALKVSPA
jgi:hypothetical protein